MAIAPCFCALPVRLELLPVCSGCSDSKDVVRGSLLPDIRSVNLVDQVLNGFQRTDLSAGAQAQSYRYG
jgi:hypothetical protein